MSENQTTWSGMSNGSPNVVIMGATRNRDMPKTSVNGGKQKGCHRLDNRLSERKRFMQPILKVRDKGPICCLLLLTTPCLLAMSSA